MRRAMGRQVKQTKPAKQAKLARRVHILSLHLIGKRMRRRREKSQHIQPTSRDLALFAYLAQLGIASDEQIRAQFWLEARLQTCVDRLEKLVQAGYLHSAFTSARGRCERTYWISRKAQRMLPKASQDQPIKAHRPAEAEVAHLLRTRDVVDLFSRSGRLISFTSEHTLKREAAHGSKGASDGQKRGGKSQVADGRLALAMPFDGAEARGEGAQEVLLEIDGAYYGKRLRAKIHALATSALPVLWVTGSRARLARLQALAAPYPGIYPVLFADLARAYAP